MSSDGRSGSVARLALVARRFHERQRLLAPQEVLTLVHEDAEVSPLPDDGRVLRGREAILEWLLDERQAFVYTGEVERYELLDQTKLLVSGQARYPVQDGVANSTVFWIDVFRDELLWRVRAFRSAGDARTAYDTGEVASRSSG